MPKIDEILSSPKKALQAVLIGVVIIIIIGIIATLTIKTDYTLHFEENMVLDYGSDENTISLIKAVGDDQITEDRIDKENNRIVFGNWQVQCEKVDTSELGSYEVVYETSDVELNKFNKTVYVRDISGPKIKVEKKKFEVYQSEVKDLNLKDNIEVSDNYSKPKDIELDFSLSVEDMTDVDTYSIECEAIDEFGNSSTKTFVVDVVEDPVQEKEEDTADEESKEENVEQPAQPSQTPAAPSTPQVTQPVQPSPPVSTPVIQDFLFNDGYTMDTVTGACAAALSSSGRSGTCQPIQDANGIYLGMRLILY